MPRDLRRRSLGAGLLAVAASLAPQDPATAPNPPPPPVPIRQPDEAAIGKLEALARARAAAAAKTFDLAWLYYSENRVDAGDVYAYSRLRLAAEQDIATTKPGRVEAAQGHWERMDRLWRKVARVKKLGFSNTLDLSEAEYYHAEAEFWLAREQAWEEK